MTSPHNISDLQYPTIQEPTHAYTYTFKYYVEGTTQYIDKDTHFNSITLSINTKLIIADGCTLFLDHAELHQGADIIGDYNCSNVTYIS